MTSRAACFSLKVLRSNYSITSSARSRIDRGTVSPSAVAVLRFTTISNLVGSCTGRSPGFAPRRMRADDMAGAQHNVPVLYGLSDFSRDGGLLSYGVDRVDISRRAVTYIDGLQTESTYNR